ncbi:hypothetical protein EYC84_007772 [Monilinia fructicola]|uniref:Uncharacterized protein n=1 Tax=Monilinia fructicola TaxID=38448 RepID=A0A5M9JH84_MONFR|nr:hypothetical protein EYC84_007772 [Monilinia fructicola]
MNSMMCRKDLENSWRIFTNEETYWISMIFRDGTYSFQFRNSSCLVSLLSYLAGCNMSSRAGQYWTLFAFYFCL